MRQNKHSIDGFVPRRSTGQVGGRISERAPDATGNSGLQRPTVGQVPTPEAPVLRRSAHGLRRSEISESLSSIDQPAEAAGGKRRRKHAKQPKSRTRRIVFWVVIGLLVIGLGMGGWLAYKAYVASSQVFKGNIFDILQSQPLKQDENGRTNILLFGTSEDDPGHDAPYLTDSIIVLSIDQKNKDAKMFNLPRDLMVEYGTACISGYRGKINEVYGCHYNDGQDEAAGAMALQKTVSEVTGVDLQYYAHVNYTVVREAVGAVGGVDITIESRDPRGQMDANFDWKCGVGDRKVSRAEVLRRCPPSGHFIDYPNGPVTLDAEHALYLAQARGEGMSYGFEMSNFDREKNQQKIIKALREKAMSAGTLTNIGKVTSLIDAFGNNLRTDFETKEISTLMTLAKDIPSDKIQSISLIDGDTAVLSGDGNPTAGDYQFGQIQAFIAKKLTSNPVVQEEAKVIVLNGSGVAGVAQTEADKLEKAGMVITDIDNAPEGDYGKATIYQLGTGMSATKAKLESLYGVAVSTEQPPVTVTGETNFVVIIGQATTQN